jgi:DNA-binding Lrp family transcriptional regulator
MNKIEMKLLSELLKDSKKSDRDLAQVLGVSQPTVSRVRSRLVKGGLIKEFSVTPDFAKMGYEIMAFSTVRFKTPSTPELMEKGRKWMYKHSNIIFAGRGQGVGGRDSIIISFHKNFTEYDEFISELFAEWGDAVEDHKSLLIPLKGFIMKPLSLKYLAEQLET